MSMNTFKKWSCYNIVRHAINLMKNFGLLLIFKMASYRMEIGITSLIIIIKDVQKHSRFV